MADNDERFDGMFLTVAQQSQGIEPLLDNLFSFLRRKTDFFSGATPEKIEELVMNVIRKHATLNNKDIAEKKAAKEKEERLKKQKLEKKKKEEEEAAKAAAAVANNSKAPDDGILELTEDGVFDTATLKATNNIPSPPVSGIKAPPEPTPAEMLAATNAETTPDKEEEEDKEPAPIGNGGKTDKYVWTQTLSEVTVNVPVPAGTKTKMLDVKISNTSLSVGLKGQAPLVSGTFHKRIIVDDSIWTLEDGDVSLVLQKDNKMEWWKCVVVGDPEINTQKVQPENSKLSDLDGETRQTVEKMMFDQRQKAMGLPSADELSKQEMLEKFMKAHPEMDFSKAKFS
eukprot:gene15417-20799_t